MPEQKKCPFCDVETNKKRILKMGARAFVMLSDPRLMEGHVLVIPNAHVGSLVQLSHGELAELFLTAIDFQEKIKKVFSQLWGKQAGCDLSQHDRGFMPTTQLSVPQHAHIHLRPRYWQDPYYEQVLRHETPVFHPLSEEEQERYHQLLAV
jgi:ATP adenylyltransferase